MNHNFTITISTDNSPVAAAMADLAAIAYELNAPDFTTKFEYAGDYNFLSISCIPYGEQSDCSNNLKIQICSIFFENHNAAVHETLVRNAIQSLEHTHNQFRNGKIQLPGCIPAAR